MGGGGGGKGASAPSAPDFNAMAENQAAISKRNVQDQTQANRVNQTNAFGARSSWTQDPFGNWSQQSSLGGGLGRGAQNLEGQIGSQGALGTGDQARDQAINATYNQYASRLDPQWNQRSEQLQTQLANQGLTPGSEAYDNAMRDFSQARNDAYQGAQNNAVTQGLQAQRETFGENLQSQMAPYQQLGALAGLAGQAGTPMAGLAETPNLLGAAQQAYQAALQGQSQEAAGKNSTMSGIGSLAGGVAGTMIAPGVGTMVGAQLGGML